MRKFKLFVIEDDPVFTEMVKDFVENRPEWEVNCFPTGEECLKKIHEFPRVVIIDYNLDLAGQGGLNGMDTLIAIKKISPASTCIFLSGQNSYGKALQTISHGAEGYIVKDENAFVELGKMLDALPAT